MADKTTKVADILRAIQSLGSITAAANHLYVSQPYISHLVAAEEKQLGLALIDRSAKPTRLTYAGTVYLRGLDAVNVKLTDLHHEMNALAQAKTGLVTLAMSESMAEVAAAPLVTEFTALNPNYHLTIDERPSRDAMAAMTDGAVDLYVGPLPPDHGDMMYRVMHQRRVVLVGPRSLAMPTQLTRLEQLRSLQNQPFISFRSDMIMAELSQQLFERAGVRVQPVLSLRSIISMRALAARGQYWALLPAGDAHPAWPADVQQIPVSPSLLSLSLIMGHRTNRVLTPAMYAFLAAAQKVYQIKPEDQVVHHVD